MIQRSREVYLYHGGFSFHAPSFSHQHLQSQKQLVTTAYLGQITLQSLRNCIVLFSNTSFMSAQGQGHQGQTHGQDHGQDHGKAPVQAPHPQYDCCFNEYGCKHKALGVGEGGACGACIIPNPTSPFRTARKRQKTNDTTI
jgi:hypothetical protein